MELGTLDSQYAGGAVRMHFRCIDSPGHIHVDVDLTGDICHTAGRLESVTLTVPIEAAAIDAFLEQVNTMETRIGSTAILEMAR